MVEKKLGTTLELLQWKARMVLDKGFEKLLKIIKKMLPGENVLPSSTYEAKKVVCPLGLEVQKIHACINDCILYRGEYENLNACPVCSALRYKIRRDDPGDVEGESTPRKRVLRRPEGSISKGYGTEEVIEFCVDFIPDLKPIGVPESRYEGRLRGKGTLGKKSATCMDGHSFTQAHYTVLHNSILVAPYKEEHKEILRSKYPEQREDWIDGEHMKTFGGWLQTRLMNVTDDEQLYLLAKQPSSTISTFQGYEINGNTFYTFAQDKKSTNQNSGVRFDAEDGNGNKVTYYGYIEEIWELHYGPNFKVPLFRCKWFNLKDGVQVDPQYGMTTVDFKNLGYDTEPFVLASEVAQTWDWPERSKFWLFAHGAGLDPKTGLIVAKGKWKEKIEGIVPKLVDAIEKVRKGEYIPDRENDELTLALGNPEHVGRVRARPGFTMKEAWPDSADTYRSRSRKKKKDADIVTELLSRVEALERNQRAPDQPLFLQDPQADAAPSQRRSSVGSSHLDGCGGSYPVDYVTEKTDCELHMLIRTASVKVAVGYVYPSEDGAMHHHMPIPPGCVRVGVDEVVSGFEKVELDIPRGEDERTLADVKHGFALWPKKYVVLLQRPPTPTHEQQMPSTPPGGSPGEQPSPHLPERDPSVSPPSRDPPLYHSPGPRSPPTPGNDLSLPPSPNSPPQTQAVAGDAELAAPDDGTEGDSSEGWSGDDEVPDYPMPHEDGGAEAELEDKDYGIVVRDSIRAEAEREARVAAYEENKQQNETVDDWLKAVSGVEDKDDEQIKLAAANSCFAYATDAKVQTGDTPVKNEPGAPPELSDGIIEISDVEEPTYEEPGPVQAILAGKEPHVEVITLSD
ncbi:hypothetical protein QYE76_047376 [Lolium multiflorum]|uniref:Transposon protein, putative, CACTA, En/Spm sub-class n=1 Tax=Lolium multiflorum TaxID=4521 RepID=A0AAD8TRQ8_LOLMU|nr:hypothetical protein QYE76_047376 [Lolium multiflorum]